jgi:hypothetical protein
LNKDFRIDILVENELIIEVKAVEILLPVHTAQLISYLKLSDKSDLFDIRKLTDDRHINLFIYEFTFQEGLLLAPFFLRFLVMVWIDKDSKFD